MQRWQLHANKNYGGLSYYMSIGYIPEDKNGSSASKKFSITRLTIWCIAQIAKELKRNDIYDEFSKPSEASITKMYLIRPRNSCAQKIAMEKVYQGV